MRFLMVMIAVMLVGCSDSPPASTAPQDPTTEAWYGETAGQVASMAREAEDAVKRHKANDASALLLQAEPLADKLLAVPRPTLAAMRAASDVDDLYGRMLLASHNFGWSRLLFQKNLARWKYWKPQTPETAERLKKAEDEIAECDRLMVKEPVTTK